MASRHARHAPIGEYIPVNINAAGTNVRLATAQGATGPALDYGHGVYLGSVTINSVGSGATLTLMNGSAGTVIATITPVTNATLQFNCVVDKGLYYTYAATTAGSLTLDVLPVPI